MEKDKLKSCWSCGEPGQKKDIMGGYCSTDSGNIIDTRATCSNKLCEFSNFIFSIKAWNSRTDTRGEQV